MDFAHLLGIEIKAWREKSNLTQSKLAVKIEKDTDYISKIERGKRVPSIKTLIKISEVLGFKLHEIFKEIDH